MLNIAKLTKAELVKRANWKCPLRGHSRHNGLEHPQCYSKLANLVEKVGYFDIETNGLFANFHILLSYAIKEKGTNIIYGRTITKEELHSPDIDKNLLIDCLNDIERFQTIITYNGSRFDIPFLRTRALKQNIEDFPLYGTIKHIDVYYIARSRLRLHRKSMAVVADTLGIRGKNHVEGDIWIKGAIQGDKKSLAYIYDHNVKDVKVLEKVYNKLEVYTKSTNRSI